MLINDVIYQYCSILAGSNHFSVQKYTFSNPTVKLHRTNDMIKGQNMFITFSVSKFAKLPVLNEI